MEGYLQVRRSKSGNWRLRYARLIEEKLYLFSSHEQSTPLGFLTVYDLLSIDKEAQDHSDDKKLMFR